MTLQSGVESRVGQVLIVFIIILLLCLITVSGKSKSDNKKIDVKALTISSLLIAIAVVLSNIKIFTMPQGGSVTLLSLLPIAIITYLYGTKRGVTAGVALGLVNLIFGPSDCFRSPRSWWSTARRKERAHKGIPYRCICEILLCCGIGHNLLWSVCAKGLPRSYMVDLVQLHLPSS